MRRIGVLTTVLLVLFLGRAAFAQPAEGSAAESPTLRLAPKLRTALLAEMAGLKRETAGLATDLAAGEWASVAARSARVRDSYVMKQKLAAAELDQLEHGLPADFHAADSAFHRHADRLAQAAHERDRELAVFYFSKLMEGCVDCHARFARHRFPGLGPEMVPAHGH
jgi:hypothetical protein